MTIEAGGPAPQRQNSGDSPPPGRGEQNTDSAPTFQTYSGKGRFAEKFFAEFDANKDGKVTHDEFNRTLAHEFAMATKGAPAMTLDQYAAMHLKDLRDQAAENFHRIDWNGDGKLTLDEYMASERDRFEQMDRNGSGVISCGSSRGSRQNGDAAAPDRRKTSTSTRNHS